MPPTGRKSRSTVGARARPKPAVSIAAVTNRRRLSIPLRGGMRPGLRAIPQQPAAGRNQGERHIDRRSSLSAEFADHRISRAADHRRSGPGAEYHRQLETGAVERERHAGGARTRVARCSTSRWSSASAAAIGKRHPARPAHRDPRPHRRGLGREPAGDRDGAAAPSSLGGRHRASLGPAGRRRYHRGAARLEQFCAQTMAGALPRNSGGRRAHRHHGGARAAGRHHRRGRGRPIA